MVVRMMLTGLAVSCLGLAGCAADREQTVQIRIETTEGTILAELYPERAPGTVENFLRYVDAGHYDGGSFHRTVRENNQPNDSIRIAVIQARVSPEHSRAGFGAIPLERSNETGLSHVDGALSMARGGPDSATSAFFICVGDQPELDFGGKRNADGQGFAAFGRVLDGMETVRRIIAAPAERQSLQPPIQILRIARVPA